MFVPAARAAALCRLSLFPLILASTTAHAIHAHETMVVQGERVGGSLTLPSLEEARVNIGRIAGGASVIDSESYRTGRVSTLQDSLGMTAGVFVQPRFGSEESRLSIRGSGLQRTFHLRGIQLLQDGVPLSLADGGGDFQAIDALSSEYIEVYRGANALQYGATTLGGAINFVSPTGYSAPRADARLEYGSFDYKRMQASSGGSHGKLDYYASLGYGAQDGYRTHSAQENIRLSANTGLSLSPALETRFFVFITDSESELPGNLTKAQLRADPTQANFLNTRDDQKRDFFLWRLANRTVYDMGNSRFEFSAFYSYKDLFHPLASFIGVIDQVTHDYGVSFRWVNNADVFGRQNIFTVGFIPQWGDTDDDRSANVLGVRGVRTNQLDLRAANYALFAENQHYVLPRLALVTGLQLTRSERRLEDLFLADGDAGFDAEYEAVSPKLGLRYELDEVSQLYGNISRSFEPPSFGELSGARLINVVADQSGTTFEVGSRGKHALLGSQWDLSYYRAWIDDEFLSLNDANGVPLGTVSADHTIHQGLELALENTLWERIVIRQTYLWNDFRFSDDRVYGDNRLAGIPEHFYRAEFLYHWPQGYYAGPMVEWVPVKAPVDHANTLFADGYATVGLRAGYRKARGFSWFADLRNLGDAEYAASTGVMADARGTDQAQFLPGDGIAAYGGIEYRF
jgi:iron complex outermembrane receptor protein